MRRLMIVVWGLSLLIVPAVAAPPIPSTGTDAARCSWEWKAGGGIGVWAERCDFDTGLWQLRFDEALPGFVLTVDDAEVAVVLQVFAKPADAPVSAILPDLRRGGYIPDDEDCVFARAAIRPATRTDAFFDIQPSGARKAAFEATPADDVPEPPCGDYGWSTHGVRYFMTDIRFPDRVVYFDTGQDGMMFDPTTVTLE